MIAESISLLTALLAYLSIIFAALSLRDHMRLAIQLLELHLIPMSTCIISIICAIVGANKTCKVLMVITLVLVVVSLIKSVKMIARYLESLEVAQLATQTKLRKSKN